MTDEQTIQRHHANGAGPDPAAAFTPEGLADRWQVSSETIRQMIRRGDLRAFRVGRLFRIPPEAVEDIERQDMSRGA